MSKDQIIKAASRGQLLLSAALLLLQLAGLLKGRRAGSNDGTPASS
ncbi:MAG: hypothetical protein IID46_01915 [Planctomycetes bacterium]|nr:hypothetical protein [Planctomycetota bacterium]